MQLLHSEFTSYSEVIRSIYLLYGQKHNKTNIKYWGDKNKLWKEKLPIIQNYFPESRFIHIVRDGRDVACSFKSLSNIESGSKYAPKLPTEINQIANRWNLNLTKINDFYKGIDPDKKITVKYEDLVLNPTKTLRSIIEFLSLEFDPIMLSYAEENRKHAYEPAEFMSWKQKLHSKPDEGNIGKYRYILNSEEIRIFESINNKWLVKYGYEQ